MNRTNLGNSVKPGFIVDYHSMDQGVGGQISWEDVPDSYKDAAGFKSIPAGKVMGVVPSGVKAGKLVPHDSALIGGANPAATEFALLASGAYENSKVAAISGYGTIVGGVIYENLLPDSSGNPKVLAPALKTGLGNSGKFTWQRRTELRG
jgi:hypothetical protein